MSHGQKKTPSDKKESRGPEGGALLIFMPWGRMWKLIGGKMTAHGGVVW